MSLRMPASAGRKGKTMNVSHVHVGVKDLSTALSWLDRVWEARPTFQNERMASVPFGGFTIFFDVSSTGRAPRAGTLHWECR